VGEAGAGRHGGGDADDFFVLLGEADDGLAHDVLPVGGVPASWRGRAGDDVERAGAVEFFGFLMATS